MEGGYDPAILATCAVQTILGFESKEVDRADHAMIPRGQQAILADREVATERQRFP
jgi:hypothetical protein